MMRLLLLASGLLQADPWKLRILDFGSGMGGFVEAGQGLDLRVWGHDIIEPRLGQQFFLRAASRFKRHPLRQVVST
jgi:hypothetical protein